MRVLIVNMPFSNLRWPNIGPSLLKAALTRRGIPCDIAYLNFDFAERIGWDDYYWIADSFGFVLGGERLFAKHYFDTPLPDDESYGRDVLLPADPGLSSEDRHAYEQLGAHVGPFLAHCQTALDWSQYDLVGFASSFQQTMPSMCLARWLKRVRPQTTIVFGGAACEGEMGRELLRRFPEIDYVFLGEADVSFPELVEQIAADGPVAVPPGVAERTSPLAIVGPEDRCSAGADPGRLVDLDQLPYPDFDDYFARLARSPLAGQFEPILFFEASRGCWWGQKHHCAFCGLNGNRLAYRSKDPNRALDELRYLTDRHGVRKVSTADNILDHRYFQSLLPRLAEADFEVGFVFEMKTNLTRAQADLLLRAGLGGAQLGIETFSTPLLRLIGKGATALHNLQALKWFSEARIEVKWNFLYGFPGEDPQEYQALAQLIPLVYHLAAPMGAGRVRADRFSPYFEDPAAHGIVNLRPNRAFHYVYPFPDESLARLAYYFEHDNADGRNPSDYAGPVMDQVALWTELQGTVTLRYWDRPDGVVMITDTRPCATALQHRLTGAARQIYLECDTGRPLARLVELAAQSDADEAAVRRILGEMVADRLMVYIDGRYLSLATRAPSHG